MKSLFSLLLSAWLPLMVMACATVVSPAEEPKPLGPSPEADAVTLMITETPPQNTDPIPTPSPMPTSSPVPVTLMTTETPPQITDPSSTPPPIPTASPVRGVFEGITPCSKLTRPLPQIPVDTNCEQMIWNFVLYQDPETGFPTTYTLNSAYGVPQPGTPGLAGGGTAIVMEGRWAIVKGTKLDPDAVFYQLNPDNPQTAVSFLKMSEDMLHILNSDQTLMIGNGAWSYTLNRTDNRSPTKVNEQSGSAAESTRPAIPPMPPGSSVLGVFEGRTPCHAIVFELTKMAPYSGCARIKWRLTLYQDQTTGAPSTYLYLGTSTIREGRWTIVRGTDSDPDAIIYQLHLDNAQQPVSFLRADENHLFLLDRAMNFLVGDALFSYTLSRTDAGAQ